MLYDYMRQRSNPMKDDSDTKCEHILHENGVHEFVLKESGVAAADAYMAGLERIYQSRTDISQAVRVLVNGGGTSLPLQYTFQRGKELIAKYPNMGMMRTATLTDKQVEARLADSFLRLMHFGNTRVRFFDLAHRDAAIEWLVKDD